MGGYAYGVPVYAALSDVNENLKDLMAQRIRQRNQEGELNLAMRKLDLEDRLAQSRGNLAMAELQANQDWRMMQARKDQERFMQQQAQASERLRLEEKKVGIEQQRADIYGKTQGMQQQVLAQTLKQQARATEPITLQQAIQEAPGIGGHVQQLFLGLLTKEDLGKTAPRQEMFQALGKVAERHPGWMVESALGVGMDQLQQMRERLKSEQDPMAAEALTEQAEDMAKRMQVLHRIQTADTVQEQQKLAMYLTKKDPNVADGLKSPGEAYEENLEFIRNAQKDMAGTSPKDVALEMKELLGKKQTAEETRKQPPSVSSSVSSTTTPVSLREKPLPMQSTATSTAAPSTSIDGAALLRQIESSAATKEEALARFRALPKDQQEAVRAILQTRK